MTATEQLPLWLTQATPFITAILASVGSFFLAKYQFNKTERESVLENQYEKVLAPLHCILFFDTASTEEEKQAAIDSLLREQYYIAPCAITECWREEPNTCFQAAVDVTYRRAAYRLGYTQIRVRKPHFPEGMPREKIRALHKSLGKRR